ncbi:MAG: transglycosylase SLT domain-containing protein [Flavobacteriales bacterium]|nr:transglycosylase SLT domain-containing protein [Flavobacteriales bacterium]MCB9193683.1 transglycosylase SLT domain-containing protein [Flavobacteriales bacterium]
MSRRIRPFILLAVPALLGLGYLVLVARRAASEDRTWERPLVRRDLAEIKADTLRVLVVDDPLCHENWPQAERGAIFEMIERFAAHEALEMAARPVPMDSLIPMLQTGRGDLIAAPLSRGSELLAHVARSISYWQVSPMVAQLRADRILGLPEPVDPDTVLVSDASPLARPSLWKDGPVRTVLPGGSTHALIEQLAMGRVGAVLVTDAEARYYARAYPQLDLKPLTADPLHLVFGMRSNSPRLLHALDHWIKDDDERDARAMLMAAYGRPLGTRRALGRSRGSLAPGDTISPFDSLFQHFAGMHGLPWELLAAIAFKESRFDSTATSHRGAQGLMQLMPRTARGLGLDSLHLVDVQVNAAATYLTVLDSIWMRSIPDRKQRLPFILAAYNTGPGHVLDAQKLAEEIGLDRSRWFGNVERAITLLAFPDYFARERIVNGRCKGSETFIYVREVLALYRKYRTASE